MNSFLDFLNFTVCLFLFIFASQTNNLIIMKKTIVSPISELSIDAVIFLFVEWLRRRGVFSAFRSNCGFGKEDENEFRTVLRYRIKDVLHLSHAGIGDLISMSFMFTRTPEGLAFWFDLSYAWRRFCADFQNNFK